MKRYTTHPPVVVTVEGTGDFVEWVEPRRIVAEDDAELEIEQAYQGSASEVAWRDREIERLEADAKAAVEQARSRLKVLADAVAHYLRNPRVGNLAWLQTILDETQAALRGTAKEESK